MGVGLGGGGGEEMIGKSVSKAFSGTNEIELPTWWRVSVTTIAAGHAMCSMLTHQLFTILFSVQSVQCHEILELLHQLVQYGLII